MSDVEAIERATIAAVAPEHVEALGDWLLAIDPGTMRRACSAVPVSHRAGLDEDLLERIEAAYAGQGRAAAFRLADVAGLEPARALLAGRDYRSEQPTLVQTCAALDLAAASDDVAAELFAAPCEGWADVFMGPGFDPDDGASRVRVLGRSRNSLFGAVRVDGKPVAVGVGSFGEGWCSVHGMRTAKEWRGRGLASRLLAAFGREAVRRDLPRAFLQVEEENAAARALYGRVGFETAWRYFYWSRPAP